MDKKLLSSLTNQGSITAMLGIGIFTLGNTLAEGGSFTTLQLIGYGLALIGGGMYFIGDRRAKGKQIVATQKLTEETRLLTAKVETLKTALKGSNGHNT